MSKEVRTKAHRKLKSTVRLELFEGTYEEARTKAELHGQGSGRKIMRVHTHRVGPLNPDDPNEGLVRLFILR